MRVIAGEFRSRVLKSMPGLEVRPTPDRLRETLFNILASRVDGVVFADIYAGTGAVGIEALSRGAARAIFVEQNRSAVGVIRENLRSLKIESRAVVRNARAMAALEEIDADIFFVDPPYPLEKEYGRSLEILGRRAPALTVVQHDKRLDLADTYGRIARVRIVKQSDNKLSFYEPCAPAWCGLIGGAEYQARFLTSRASKSDALAYVSGWRRLLIRHRVR